ncbi:hypothetical protein V8E51_013476 [Hyaloscypha variabilis]
MTPSVEGTKRRPESETPCFDAGMRKFPPVSVHMQSRHDPDYRPVPEDWRGNGWGRKTELSHFHCQRWNAIAEIREFDHALTIIAMDKKAGTELAGWFDISLVTLQQALVEKASGPANFVNQGGSIVSPGPNDSLGRKLCNSQMIRNVSGYENFSTFGVALILIIGTTLVILGWTLDIIVGFFQRYLFRRNFARLSWASDSYLQLQRMAYEGAGYTDWKYCADYVPVSGDLDRASQRLGPLNIDDLDHPRFARSVTAATGGWSPTQSKTPEVTVKDEGSHQEGYPMLGWEAGV